MVAINLVHIDDDRNMARFYKIEVQPTLFGEWARVGEGGTVRSTSFGTASQA